MHMNESFSVRDVDGRMVSTKLKNACSMPSYTPHAHTDRICYYRVHHKIMLHKIKLCYFTRQSKHRIKKKTLNATLFVVMYESLPVSSVCKCIYMRKCNTHVNLFWFSVETAAVLQRLLVSHMFFTLFSRKHDNRKMGPSFQTHIAISYLYRECKSMIEPCRRQHLFLRPFKMIKCTLWKTFGAAHVARFQKPASAFRANVYLYYYYLSTQCRYMSFLCLATQDLFLHPQKHWMRTSVGSNENQFQLAH